MPDRNGNPKIGESVNVKNSTTDTAVNWFVYMINYLEEEVLIKRYDTKDIESRSFDDFDGKWNNKFTTWMLEE